METQKHTTMKTLKTAFGVLLALMLVFTACKKENLQDNKDILPSKFKVDIPQSISSDEQQKLYSEDDTVMGPEVYRHLRTFIHVGEFASDIVQDLINTIREYNLSQEMSFSFTSDDDNRVKNVVIVANQTFENRTWEYKMTVTDAENEQNEDGGMAMEIYWNTNPVEGIAIINFKNLNANVEDQYNSTMFRVEYSENPSTTMGYDEIMRVMISDWPIDTADRFSMKNLMMFVGRKGDRVDVYGNSDHPFAWLLIPDHPGLDWAFVASSNRVEDIAVAEVGLPPNTLNTTQRSVILGQYSLKNVLMNEITEWFNRRFHVLPDSASLAHYLHNADAPGMFNKDGFVQGGGTPPSDSYNELIDAIQDLTPYNPYDVAQLHISFSAGK